MLKILNYDKPKQIIEEFENERNNSLEIFNPLSEVIKGLLKDLEGLSFIRVKSFKKLLSGKQDELLEKAKPNDIKNIMFSFGYVQ